MLRSNHLDIIEITEICIEGHFIIESSFWDQGNIIVESISTFVYIFDSGKLFISKEFCISF